MKLFLVASILAATFFHAGIWNTSLPSDPASPPLTIAPTTSPDRADTSQPPKIRALNSIVFQGDVLELHFTTPNAPFLGVIDPAGHFFYLVFPGEEATGALKPLVESKQFAALQTLKINTQTLRADPYTYGVYTNQPVFTTSGTYTFILGRDLHVDDPGLLDKVSVRYIHSRRPEHGLPAIATN